MKSADNLFDKHRHQSFTPVSLVIFVAAIAMNMAGFAMALSPAFKATVVQFETEPAPPEQESPTDPA
jgi:hypothetical protein